MHENETERNEMETGYYGLNQQQRRMLNSRADPLSQPIQFYSYGKLPQQGTALLLGCLQTLVDYLPLGRLGGCSPGCLIQSPKLVRTLYSMGKKKDTLCYKVCQQYHYNVQVSSSLSHLDKLCTCHSFRKKSGTQQITQYYSPQLSGG